MDIPFDRPCDDDIEIVHRQLAAKRKKDVLCIAKRCKFGYPSAVILNPLSDGQINMENLSSPLWLTCPWLNYEIHELENRGYIKKINELILSDRDFLYKMMESHAHFYFFRRSLCLKAGGAEFLEKTINFFNRGIGGIQNIMYIKCMHLHFAHYLINNLNLVGHITDGLLCRKNSCDDGYCICLKK